MAGTGVLLPKLHNIMESTIAEPFGTVLFDFIHFLDDLEMVLYDRLKFGTVGQIQEYNSDACDIRSFFQGLFISLTGRFFAETIQCFGSMRYVCELDGRLLGGLLEDVSNLLGQLFVLGSSVEKRSYQLRLTSPKLVLCFSISHRIPGVGTD